MHVDGQIVYVSLKWRWRRKHITYKC